MEKRLNYENLTVAAAKSRFLRSAKKIGGKVLDVLPFVDTKDYSPALQPPAPVAQPRAADPSRPMNLHEGIAMEKELVNMAAERLQTVIHDGFNIPELVEHGTKENKPIIKIDAATTKERNAYRIYQLQNDEKLEIYRIHEFTPDSAGLLDDESAKPTHDHFLAFSKMSNLHFKTDGVIVAGFDDKLARLDEFHDNIERHILLAGHKTSGFSGHDLLPR